MLCGGRPRPVTSNTQSPMSSLLSRMLADSTALRLLDMYSITTSPEL